MKNLLYTLIAFLTLTMGNMLIACQYDEDYECRIDAFYSQREHKETKDAKHRLFAARKKELDKTLTSQLTFLKCRKFLERTAQKKIEVAVSKINIGKQTPVAAKITVELIYKHRN